MVINKGLLYTGLALELPEISGMWIGLAAAATAVFGLLFVVSILRYRAQNGAAPQTRQPYGARGNGARGNGHGGNGSARGYGNGDGYNDGSAGGYGNDDGYDDGSAGGYGNGGGYHKIGRDGRAVGSENDPSGAYGDEPLMEDYQDMDMNGFGTTMAVEQAPAQPVRQTRESESRPRGIYVSKMHNIGRRGSQQDSFGISQDGTRLECSGKGVFAIVADGMGGLSNGGEVSARVTMSMMRSFDQQTPSADGDRELLSMLNKANDEVNDMLAPSGQGKSGSTVVSVLIRDMQLYWIAVGDSHIYLYRDGALMQINRDHVYSVDLDEMAARGEISVREAAEDPQRKALTSYIGMGKLAKIDRNIRPLQLQSGDRVLLMTDGVFGTLSDEEITAAMKLPVDESSQAMEQMILGKNKATQDNFTALILECV